MTILQHALEAASQGFRVFPCLPRKKNPAIMSWPTAATTDEEQIAKWWEENPEYNYGIVAANSGHFILDLDNKPGMKEAVTKLSTRAKLLSTKTCLTPNGGTHLYYTCPKDHGLHDLIGEAGLGTGIDIRFIGYVVGPGSIVTDKDGKDQTYRWLDDQAPMVEAHPSFLEACWEVVQAKRERRANSPQVAIENPDSIDKERTWANAKKYMDKPEGLPEGNRNHQAYFLACRLTRGFALPETQAIELLAAWNDRNNPPLPDDELMSVMASSWKHGNEPIGAYATLRYVAPEEVMRRKTTSSAVDDFLADDTVVEVPADLPPEIIPEPSPDLTAEPPPVLCKWSQQQYTVEDFRNFIDDTKYLVPGVIAERTVNVVYGAPGSHKSNYCLDQAVRAASGEYGRPLRVGWIDQDNGHGIMKERIDAFTKAICPESKPYIVVLCFPDPSPTFAREDVQMELKAWVEENKLDIIYIDNLLRISGGLDENSTEMDVPLRVLRTLAQTTGCASSVIHHKRKSDATGGEDMRGSTAIEAAVDSTFRVTRKQQSNTITVTNVKARRCPAKTRKLRFEFTHKVASPYVLETAYFIDDTDDDDPEQSPPAQTKRKGHKDTDPSLERMEKVEPLLPADMPLNHKRAILELAGIGGEWAPRTGLTQKLRLTVAEIDSLAEWIETENHKTASGRETPQCRIKPGLLK